MIYYFKKIFSISECTFYKEIMEFKNISEKKYSLKYKLMILVSIILYGFISSKNGKLFEDI